MVIRTKLFSFTPAIYFKILFKNSFKRSAWLLALLAVLIGFQWSRGFSPLLLGGAGGLFGFLVFLAIRCQRHVRAKRNPLFYADRSFEIDSLVLTCRFANGTRNPVKMADFRRVVRTPRHFELYLNRKQFIYLPVAAFASEHDLRLFQTLIQSQ
ncbi:hypothetical protein EDC14_102957 [Hydrogenispora ethanolica]|uniref:YcxB-like C-terminal domain-containing protein n=1 Tax=Hydrogenispora ethanolica TaxID=1082276 RepID=A0A4R1R8T2_HYDET|nr:YcxB family protein [Hydrogenispora ethanolica]TCL62028.1 hypothetical protein EDC14_102957 [Hydrogenispora ethanolica]